MNFKPLPPRIENEIDDLPWASELPELRNYLVNNSYEKIVDLEERNLRLARFY